MASHNPGYLYRCKITDGNGNVAYSQPGEIRDDPVAILTQPVDYYGELGSTIRFTVAAYGTNLTYCWQTSVDGGGTWYNSGASGVNTPTMSTPMTVDSPGYLHRCKVTDGNGNVVYSKPGRVRPYCRTWENTYNADGLRTSRTDGGTTYSYVYNGGKLSRMTVHGDTLYFAYDASGTPMAVTYNGTTYYYVTNIQGDVIGILNSAGTQVVTYTYDAWGSHISTTGSMASTLGARNPLRYRGYVYDQETGLYYLQSRYYDPQVGRFINADAFTSTGQGLLGNNMFAYCNNNVVNYIDTLGTLAKRVGINANSLGSDLEGMLGTYRELKKLTAGTGYQVHHLVEQRFYRSKEMVSWKATPLDTPAVILKKSTHQYYTNLARGKVPYGSNYTVMTKTKIYSVVKDIYGGKPDWVDYIASYFK